MSPYLIMGRYRQMIGVVSLAIEHLADRGRPASDNLPYQSRKESISTMFRKNEEIEKPHTWLMGSKTIEAIGIEYGARFFRPYIPGNGTALFGNETAITKGKTFLETRPLSGKIETQSFDITRCRTLNQIAIVLFIHEYI